MAWSTRESLVRLMLLAKILMRVPVCIIGIVGVVESLKIITREKSQRIAKYAFDYATRHERKRVTAIHKANIMSVIMFIV